MNTPTHLLISSVLLARPGAAPADKRRNFAVIAGALVPDTAIFAMFFWTRLVQGASEQEVWSTLYWREPWQSLVAIGNSLPIYAALLGLAMVSRRPVVVAFAVSALLHLAFDFPFHHDDAHPHFWPFSDWRFISPVSYWDPDHFGALVSVAEAAVALALIAVLWRRFSGRIVRAALLVALASYVAVPIYFNLMLG